MKKSTNRTRKWRGSHQTEYRLYMYAYRHVSIRRALLDVDEYAFEFDSRKRKSIIQATPDWADRQKIREIYIKCADLNDRYPNTGFIVHHIIPISHCKVCGLHIVENLKIMSASMKKLVGRRFNSKDF